MSDNAFPDDDGDALLFSKAEDGKDEPPPTHYPNHVAWVVHWLAPMYSRSVEEGVSERTWCAHWVKHAEANSRLNSLWRSWEWLRLDGKTGMAVWWRDHADHHMPKLFDPNGTFRYCTPEPWGHLSKNGGQPLLALSTVESTLALIEVPAMTAGQTNSTSNGKNRHA